MSEVIGVVEQGRIKLPENVRLSEGQSVHVLLEGAWDTPKIMPPLEDEEWTEEDIQHELEWATGKQFPK